MFEIQIQLKRFNSFGTISKRGHKHNFFELHQRVLPISRYRWIDAIEYLQYWSIFTYVKNHFTSVNANVIT